MLLFGLSLAFAAATLEFEQDRDALASPNDKLQKLKAKFFTEFPPVDEVVVVIQGGEQRQREELVELLADMFGQHPQQFSAIFPFLELPDLNRQTLMFLSEEELQELVIAVGQAKPALQSLNSPKGLLAMMDGLQPNSEEDLAFMLPFLVESLRGIHRAISSRGRAHYQSPWSDVILPDSSLSSTNRRKLEADKVYHTLDDGRVHLLLLHLVDKEPATIELLRELTGKAGRAHPSLILSLTGSALLEHDEMETSEGDSRRSALLSLVLVGALFALAFQQMLRPLAAVFCLILSVGWTVGFTALAIGRLNVLTVTFATIMIGLGIDFSIHLLFRYEEEFLQCGNALGALEGALRKAGPNITVGAISTVVAFGTVGLTNFVGVSELGIIAGAGVLFCLVATLLVLPALLVEMDKKREFSSGETLPSGWRIILASIEDRFLRHTGWILGGLVLFVVLAFPWVSKVEFDYNLLHLQDPSLESVQAELELIEKGGNTILFSIAVADSVAHANELKAQFEALPSVRRAESVSQLFPSRSQRKIELVQELQGHLKGLRLEEPLDSQGPVGLEALGDEFLALQNFFESQKAKLLSHESSKVRRAAVEFEELWTKLAQEMSEAGPGPVEDGLVTYQRDFKSDLFAIVTFLRNQSAQPSSLRQLPENLQIRSVGRTGKLAVYIYPKENIWERPALERFVKQVRSVDPDALGDAVTIYHYTQALRVAFERSGLYALLVVSVMLLLYFRSLAWTLLALLPLVTGIYAMLFAMSCYGLAFNPANFMGLPLLLGIGLDFGIHVLHRAKEEKKVTMFAHSTGPATAVSALTTILGFGTLALGGHRGVASLGFLLAAGVTGIMISALLILPALLNLWSPFPKSRLEEEDTVESQWIA